MSITQDIYYRDTGRKGEAGTPVLHIKILGFNRHKR